MDEKIVRKKRRQDSNRLTLTDKAQEKATVWLSQIEKEFNGMLSIKRNDLLNTILEELDDSLSSLLLSKIREEKLTGKEKAKWIYQQFLKAEKEGVDANLDELIKTAQGGPKRRKKARKTKARKSQTPLSESAEISPKTKEKVL